MRNRGTWIASCQPVLGHPGLPPGSGPEAFPRTRSLTPGWLKGFVEDLAAWFERLGVAIRGPSGLPERSSSVAAGIRRRCHAMDIIVRLLAESVLEVVDEADHVFRRRGRPSSIAARPTRCPRPS